MSYMSLPFYEAVPAPFPATVSFVATLARKSPRYVWATGDPKPHTGFFRKAVPLERRGVLCAWCRVVHTFTVAFTPIGRWYPRQIFAAKPAIRRWLRRLPKTRKGIMQSWARRYPRIDIMIAQCRYAVVRALSNDDN